MADAAQIFSITSLTLNGKYPLSACTATFEMGGIPVCTVVPVVGTTDAGRTAGAAWLAQLGYGTEAEVELTYKGGSLVLFKGRISSVQMDASAGGYGMSGRSMTIITITHMMGDLDAISFGQREFIIGGWRDRFEPEHIKGSMGALLDDIVMNTPPLQERKVASHISYILDALTKWYQHKTTGLQIDVASLLKATNVVIRDFGFSASVINGVVTTTIQAIDGGLKAKATVLGIARTLADFCMLTIAPRLTDCVLIPNIPMIKQYGGTPFGSKYVTGVWRGVRSPVLPTTHVAVHAMKPARYSSELMGLKPADYEVNLQSWSVLGNIVYPPIGEDTTIDNVLVAMPPPILVSALNSVLMPNDDEKPVEPKWQVPTTHLLSPDENLFRNRSGEAPKAQAEKDGVTIGEAAAKALYCAVAYRECTSKLLLAPGYVLGGGLRRDSTSADQGWEDGTLWSIIGKVISFQSAYSEQGKLVKQDLVGYVNTMTVEIDRTVPSASVSLGLSHVRTALKDRQHSINSADHPLFTKVTGLKVQ